MRKVRSAVELKVGEKHLKCSRCGEVKELTSENFYRTTNGSLGFQSVCKQCRSEYYRENKDKKIEYQKNYWKQHIGFYREYSRLYMKDKSKAKELSIKDYREKNRNKEKIFI